ncbi:hypothetical protein P6144_16755 [Sphingomonas sp. HITSZ_GF]|uniref:hypothetical protein n=1 Tax=Sphingomonas sp. HITSZ_GF TaxID=3037247 RepID=UPI00240DBF80|nr:hypothetical protein [Sphingomonas sp. HITSZ_GF]MDG2535313.1 hypothetical protein [Sphingomonas sp. HITSZ_GF]
MRGAGWGIGLAVLLAASPAMAQTTPGATPPPAPAPCRQVGDVPVLVIDADSAARLGAIGLDRAAIFAQMHETSIPETSGCWADPTGNFDGQLISVGMSQWNFGTGSLQPLLKAWKKGQRRFGHARKALMPAYGRTLFSRDCLAVPVKGKCRARILAAHGPDGKLNPVIRGELAALFESDGMMQVQLDAYLVLLEGVRQDLLRVFPGQPITPRKVRWAVDTKVQQGGFPLDEDLARLRRKLAAMPEGERWDRLAAIFQWYGALARSIDQDGVQRDWTWNVDRWRCMLETRRIDPEQYEMLHLTFLRSRTAIGNSGRWQALTFERRAKIILGVGSVAGKTDGECLR